MTNKIVITPEAKVLQVQQSYYAPVAVITSKNNLPVETNYCFLSRVDPWPQANTPPVPGLDQKSRKEVFKNIFAVKKVNTSDISPVIQRINWESGTIYDFYRDDINILEQDENGNLVYNFYVKNRYDQVFKCLWNGNGAAATDEPMFTPGTYGTNNIYVGSDGYKWKFIYSIDTGLKVKFMDTKWMPVGVSTTSLNALTAPEGIGGVEVINVYSGGSGYDAPNATITVTVTGDGNGAVATANTSNGSIIDIIVTNPGANYTYANVTITTALGNGVVAYANTSPVGGHGFDPISELGCSHVMYSVEFNGSENGEIPTDIDFHQLGLVVNPTSKQSSPNPANGSIYRTTTDLIVAPGFGTFERDEVVYQGSSLAAATFTAKVLSFDVATNVLRLINTTGTPALNGSVYGNTSSTARTVLTISYPNFVLFSGYLAYIENRESIQRSADGIEQYRFVLGY
jgi:hypothetical protein